MKAQHNRIPGMYVWTLVSGEKLEHRCVGVRCPQQLVLVFNSLVIGCGTALSRRRSSLIRIPSTRCGRVQSGARSAGDGRTGTARARSTRSGGYGHESASRLWRAVGWVRARACSTAVGSGRAGMGMREYMLEGEENKDSILGGGSKILVRGA